MSSVNLVLRRLMIQSNTAARALRNITVQVVSVFHSPNTRSCLALVPSPRFPVLPRDGRCAAAEQLPSSTVQYIVNYTNSLGQIQSRSVSPSTGLACLLSKPRFTFFPFRVLGERFLDFSEFRINY